MEKGTPFLTRGITEKNTGCPTNFNNKNNVLK